MGRGRRGEPTGREGHREHVRRSGPSGLRRWSGQWRTTEGRHTETHDRRVHHHESSNHRFFPDIFRGSSICYLRH